jgi:ribosomal protein S18 acetylase RimI-like enzyme
MRPESHVFAGTSASAATEAFARYNHGILGPYSQPRSVASKSLPVARNRRMQMRPPKETKMSHPLDNPIWHALTGPHANLAIGRGAARRYKREIAPFAGIAEPGAAAYADLAADLPLGSEARLFRPRDEPVPDGWEALGSNPLPQMILPSDDLLPDPQPAEARATPLGLDDAADMLALAAATKPGPFGPRTVELGGYVGVRDPDGRLIAMAGERLRLPGYVELSAICVHPDARGQGLGAALTLRVARVAFAREEVPFLHVWPDNPARALYTRLGFRVRATLWVLWRRPIPVREAD